MTLLLLPHLVRPLVRTTRHRPTVIVAALLRFRTAHSSGPTTKPPGGGCGAAAPSVRPTTSPWGILARAAAAYSRSQRRRPYLTPIVSSLVVFLCGDLSAQTIDGDEYDAVRTIRSMIIGGAVAVPHYRWFVLLSRNFNYASRALSLVTKVVVNQLFFTPLFNCYFFGAHVLLSGEGPSAALQRLRDTVPISWLNSFKVWPAVMAFSFVFLPLEFRSIFAGVVAVGWQSYLSYLNKRAEVLEKAGLLAEA